MKSQDGLSGAEWFFMLLIAMTTSYVAWALYTQRNRDANAVAEVYETSAGRIVVFRDADTKKVYLVVDGRMVEVSSEQR